MVQVNTTRFLTRGTLTMRPSKYSIPQVLVIPCEEKRLPQPTPLRNELPT